MPSVSRLHPEHGRRRLALAVALYAGAWGVYSLLGHLHDALPLPTGVDPLLYRLPYIELPWLLSQGFLSFNVAVFVCWWKWERERFPFYLSMAAFFIFVRTIFIVLGPVGAPASIAPLYASPMLSWLRGWLFFDTEQFFSGHTGIPYLYFLLSRTPNLRRACLAFSVVMGIGVLVSRNHYWIDVLGAYFMTYSIHRLGRRLWARFIEAPTPSLDASPV